ALLVVMGVSEPARAQLQLPQLTVTAAKKRPPQPRRARPRLVTAPARTVTAPAPSVAPTTAPTSVAEVKNNAFHQARSNLYTTMGTTSDTITHENIQAAPQDGAAPAEKVLLQAPGVSQDSAAGGLLHVRNDHANVQFRINGVMLPDGVTGFGSILGTDMIGTIALITGALPAEFGLRTVGLVDITTRPDLFNNSGSALVLGIDASEPAELGDIVGDRDRRSVVGAVTDHAWFDLRRIVHPRLFGADGKSPIS
ncbi:MAG TPA: hypothetical protein VGJ20_40355, partial [Xanthobacteraceae bacterium]